MTAGSDCVNKNRMSSKNLDIESQFRKTMRLNASHHIRLRGAVIACIAHMISAVKETDPESKGHPKRNSELMGFNLND